MTDSSSETLGVSQDGNTEALGHDNHTAEDFKSMTPESLQRARSILGLPPSDHHSGGGSTVRLAIELNIGVRLVRVQVLIQQKQLEQAQKVLPKAFKLADVIQSNFLMGKCHFWTGMVLLKSGMALNDVAHQLLLALERLHSFVGDDVQRLNLDGPWDIDQPCIEIRLLPRYLQTYYDNVVLDITEQFPISKRSKLRALVEEFMRMGGQVAPAEMYSLSNESDQYLELLEQVRNPMPATSGRTRSEVTVDNTGSARQSAASQIRSSFEGVDRILERLMHPWANDDRLRLSRERQLARTSISGSDSVSGSYSTGAQSDLVGQQNQQSRRTISLAEVQAGMFPSMDSLVQDRGNFRLMRPRSEPTSTNLTGATEIGQQRRETTDLSSLHETPSDAASFTLIQSQGSNPALRRFLHYGTSGSDQASSSSSQSDDTRSPSSNEAVLTDAVALELLDRRIDDMRRRRSVDAGRPSLTSIRTSPTSPGSGVDGDLRHLRRHSTEPSSPSPLRETFVPPEDVENETTAK